MESENLISSSRVAVNNHLTLIGNKKGSQKNRRNALKSISETKLYPEIFTSPRDYLDNCIAPIVSCFDDDSDAMRENSVATILKILPQLGNTNLDETYQKIAEKTFYSIDRESTEEVSLLLVQLTKYLLELSSNETNPPNFDEYCPKTLLCLSKKLRERNPEMLKLACSTIDSLIKHCSQECLLNNANIIIPHLLNTCSHNQLVVRKQALLVLGNYYVESGSVHSLDVFCEKQEKFMEDPKQVFRTALVRFCRKLLIKHPQRLALFSDHLYPLLVSLYKLVPQRPISPSEVIKPIEETKEMNESITAFDALVKIGDQYKKDDPFLKDHPEVTIQFDEKRTYGIGLLSLMQNHFKDIYSKIKANLSDFKANTRKLGYTALISILQLAHEFASRFSYEILPKLTSLLINYPDESEIILRCFALTSSLTQLADVNEILLPKLTSEDVQTQEIEAYSVCLLNSPNDNDKDNESLEKAVSTILETGIWQKTENLNAIAQCVLSICKKNNDFKEKHIVEILNIILRVGEQGDSIPHFKDCFSKPIDVIIGENIKQLFEIPGKTPRFIEQILLTSPISYISAENDLVCNTIQSALKGYPTRTQLYSLVSQLCEKKAIVKISDQLLQAILDDMVWNSPLECIAPREKATIALGTIIRTGALSKERMNSKINDVFAMALSSLDDQSSDIVRTAAITTITEVVIRTDDIQKRYERLFDALKERLSDSLPPVRIGSANLMNTVITKWSKIKEIPNRLAEVIIFLDDESIEMREAITRFIYTCASIPQWKQSVIDALNHIIQHRYHPEAEVAAKEILTKLQ